MGRIGKIADRFQTDHGGNLLATDFAPVRVNKASHLLCQKIRRLLVHKRDEPQRLRYRPCGKAARPREHRSHSAAIVVRTGRAENGIVMPADEKNLRTSTANFRLDVVTGASLQLITVTARLQTGARKGILDKSGGANQLLIAGHISFPDFATQNSHISN